MMRLDVAVVTVHSHCVCACRSALAMFTKCVNVEIMCNIVDVFFNDNLLIIDLDCPKNSHFCI